MTNARVQVFHISMISTMSLKALAETVTAHSRELDERGVVDPESLVGFRILSPDDLACRSRLLTAIEELRRLALGPAEALQEMMSVAVRPQPTSSTNLTPTPRARRAT